MQKQTLVAQLTALEEPVADRPSDPREDAGRDHAARGSEAAHITATSARTRPSPGIHGVSGVALGF